MMDDMVKDVYIDMLYSTSIVLKTNQYENGFSIIIKTKRGNLYKTNYRYVDRFISTRMIHIKSERIMDGYLY